MDISVCRYHVEKQELKERKISLDTRGKMKDIQNDLQQVYYRSLHGKSMQVRCAIIMLTFS